MTDNKMNAADIRKAILEANDLPTEEVEAWGMTLTVRGLSAADRDQWQSSLVRLVGDQVIPTPNNASAKLVAKCVIDPDSGDRIFKDADIEALGRKSGRELERVYRVAQRLSGIGEDALEAMRKNSEGSQSDVSPID